MSIRNCIGVPDDQVPAWVRERREASRAAHKAEQRRLCSCGEHFPRRNELLGHLDQTGHKPLVEDPMDSCLVRIPPYPLPSNT